MPVDLKQLIDASSPEWTLALEKLQGNILQSHGRDHTTLVMFQLSAGSHVRGGLRGAAAKWCTSAAEQLRQKERYHASRADGTVDQQMFGSLFLSVWGYLSLGYEPDVLKKCFSENEDKLFQNWFLGGMVHHGSYLGDPLPAYWELPYQNHLDGVLLLACDDLDTLRAQVGVAVCELSEFSRVTRVEWGKTIRREDGRTLEHFGFLDGISQPNCFEGAQVSPSDRCRPELLLVKDGLVDDPDALGSYLVYRKLEQNVKAFRAAENALADKLQLQPNERERAGAMIIGRFRDGSPITQYDRSCDRPDNDFDFNSEDSLGLKCPLHAHIRKVRPRPENQRRIMRRGVPYGEYRAPSSDALPEHGCGLLFMSFQANIFQQFGFVQHEWANAVDFPRGSLAGPDPLVGQARGSAAQRWPKAWGEPDVESLSLGGYVTLKGGEFFFAPSLPFFRNL